jgi:RalA-binding protein 1
VFGVSLQEAVSVARIHDGLDLPAIVFRCVEFLEAKGAIEEEGIYRLSGSSVIIKGYKERFNTEGDFNLLESSKDEYHDVHAVAGLLKQFLRELASPILTRELHGEFLKVIGGSPSCALEINPSLSDFFLCVCVCVCNRSFAAER